MILFPLRQKGFTIVELMVVIAIIAVMVTIVLASILDARKDSRDKRRVSDVANYAHALTLYKEKNRDYPSHPQGVELGNGGVLDTELQFLNGNLYTDPLGSESSEYSYWYYSDFLCDGQRVHVVIAKSMEKEANGNFDELCGASQALAKPTLQNLFSAHSVGSLHVIPRALAQEGTGYNGTPSSGNGSCSNIVGSFRNCTQTVNTASKPTKACTVSSFVASPSVLPYGGGTVNLSWVTTLVKAKGVSISPAGLTALGNNAAVNVSVSSPTTFTLTGDGTSGRPDCSRTVFVDVEAQGDTPVVPDTTTDSGNNTSGGGSEFDGSYIIILK